MKTILTKKQIEELVETTNSKKIEQYIHTPYADASGRLPDFEVEYEFECDPKLGPVKPTQGMRCDFLYDGEDPKLDGVHMIWPELHDAEGEVIKDKRIVPAKKGKATMWILSHDSRVKFHQQNIKVGIKGSWVVGGLKLARVRVTKILGLFENEA
jgi:hypothetical protein